MLVLPSRYEGRPLSLIEAMWCGRPAVVTDVGGNAELCMDGETGFVAQAPNVPAFSNALEKAWERRTEWQKLGEASRARAERLVPKDPAALFCERLMACAAKEFTQIQG
jgi:glycosyltransferase involved in cell wall biosynthesis